ncbi:MAG: 6-phosphofructokinase [Thermoflexales bacterium]|nr:6-phosphofructokinase [Thermoflexales bacterium]
MHIGILTGGGDAPGLNAAIRAVVKTAINEYNWRVTGIEDGFDGLIEKSGARARSLSLKDVQGILTRGGTILGAANRGNPFARTVIRDGEPVTEDASGLVIERLAELGIDAVVIVGGNGTLRIANELTDKGCRLVGIPKTIDNDVNGTDTSFGFDTALTTATEAIDKLHTTAESHHRAMVVEVMGRSAGWISLHAGLAGGANVILIPEIPFRWGEIATTVKERAQSGEKYSIVVVAEGAISIDGERVFMDVSDGSSTRRRFGGIGHLVAERITELSGLETRCTILGHIQRGGSPTPFDRLLATRYGAGAVHLVAQRKFGHMVALRGQGIVAVPFSEVVEAYKQIDPHSERIQVARGLGVSFG